MTEKGIYIDLSCKLAQIRDIPHPHKGCHLLNFGQARALAMLRGANFAQAPLSRKGVRICLEQVVSGSFDYPRKAVIARFECFPPCLVRTASLYPLCNTFSSSHSKFAGDRRRTAGQSSLCLQHKCHPARSHPMESVANTDQLHAAWPQLRQPLTALTAATSVYLKLPSGELRRPHLLHVGCVRKCRSLSLCPAASAQTSRMPMNSGSR